MYDAVMVPGATVATLSPLVLRTPGMATLLGGARVVPLVPGRHYDAVVGWGRKPASAWAEAYARAMGLPFFFLEDGFLRSVGLGRSGAPPLSIVIDDQGIHYDGTRRCRLESLLAEDTPALRDPDVLARAHALRAQIVEHGLSKYNASRATVRVDRRRPRILLVDQVRGDLSLRYGGVVSGVPEQMVRAAAKEHPGASLLLKAHPDGRRSALRDHIGGLDVEIVPGDVNPIRLLQSVDQVYVMTSLLGFEALLCDTPVSVFGRPFYAGWGLTDDRSRQPFLRRDRARSVTQLLAATHLLYARYFDPDSGLRTSVEQVVSRLVAAIPPLSLPMD